MDNKEPSSLTLFKTLQTSGKKTSAIRSLCAPDQQKELGELGIPQDKVCIAWGLNKQTEKQKADALAMVKKMPVQIVNGDDRYIHSLARPKNSENKGTTGFSNAGKCNALIP